MLRCLRYFLLQPLQLSLSAADARGVHASTIVVDGGGTPSTVGQLASMPVEDGPGGGGRKTDVVES